MSLTIDFEVISFSIFYFYYEFRQLARFGPAGKRVQENLEP
jgi:hypothetical protein